MCGRCSKKRTAGKDENLVSNSSARPRTAGKMSKSEIGHSTRNQGRQKQKTAFYQKNGGVNIMTLGCFAASGPGQLAVIELTMNSHSY